MFCPKCGSQVPEGTGFCLQCSAPVEEQENPVMTEPEVPIAEPIIPQPVVEEPPVAVPDAAPVVPTPPVKQEKNPGKTFKPSPPVRILLRIASVVLSLFLIGSLIATALVIDGRRLTDQDNVTKVVNTLMQEDSSEAAFNRDDLTREKVVELVVEELKTRGGDKMTVTKEQALEFLDNSNAGDFMSEKAAGFVTDFINGTQETTLRKSEVIEMLEENEEAAEEAFGVDLNTTVKQDVTNFMERNDVEKIIRKKVFTRIKSMNLLGDYDIGELLEDFREMTSVTTLLMLILLDILLIGLLWLTSWFRIGVTMKRVGITMVVAGGLLSIPTLLLQLVPIGGGMMSGIIQTLVGVMAPVHYTLLGLGVVFIIGGIVVKILTKAAKA